MKESLLDGTFTSKEDLLNAFKSISSNKKNSYKYTFKNTLCSYDEYCLYEGEWTDGI